MYIQYPVYFILSGFLLAATTPSVGIWPLVFIALTPLIYGLEVEYSKGVATYRGFFLKGYIVGCCYATSLFYWLINITTLALLPIVALFACFHGLLAIGILFGIRAGFKGTTLSLWTACLFVSLEVLGSELFFNLPSYAIGYLVWKAPYFIQIADITGVFGVSFWIIAVNILVVRWLRDGIKKIIPWIAITVCLSITIILYGDLKYNLEHNEPLTPPLQVALVHTAVTSEDKKDPNLKRVLFSELEKMTMDSFLTQKRPYDLTVWPETSVPLFLRSVKEKVFLEGLLEVARNTQSAIVIGARAIEKNDSGNYKAFNSAFLIPPKGYISQEYHKMILAPLVEKKPINKFLSSQTSGQELMVGIEPGQEIGIMKSAKANKFGVFICWEAFFPDFVRQLPQNGALYLVNISNDEAAFGKFKPAYPIPLPHAVFRAIENRRFVMRCANWGTSLFITPQGKISNASQNGSSGVLRGRVLPKTQQTFFTKNGFLLAQGLFFFTLLWFFSTVLYKKIADRL